MMKSKLWKVVAPLLFNVLVDVLSLFVVGVLLVSFLLGVDYVLKQAAGLRETQQSSD